MGDENPIRALVDYSKPSHESYKNTIELPEGNNVVPLRSDTIRLVQNGCSFHGLRSEDPNQHLKDFLKLVDSFDLDQDPSPHERILLLVSLLNSFHREGLQNFEMTSLCSNDIKESLSLKHGLALLEDLALYDKVSRNDPRDFAKPVKAISLPQDVPSTSDRRLIELENQVQRLMKAYLAPKQPVQVNKITSLCEICTGLHDTQYYMESPEQAFVEYESSLLKAITDRITGALPSDTVKNPKLNVNSTSPIFPVRSYPTEDPQCSTQIYSSINAVIICPKQPEESQNNKPEEEREENDNPKYINTNSSSPPDPSVSFITEKVRQLNSFFESLSLVPQSSDTEFVYTKGDDSDVMFIEIIKKNDDSHEEEPEVDENVEAIELKVEYFDIFSTRSELAYHKYLMSDPIPSIFLRNPIIREGCPSNLKIPCNIGHVHVENAYIDLNSPSERHDPNTVQLDHEKKT
ncbi:hypothetical protein Tco_1415153 [Tanacetum coccineum]